MEWAITPAMSRFRLPFVVAFAALLASAGAPASPFAEAAASLDRSERAMIRHVNAFRASHGLPRVRASRRLSRAADTHSRDMVERSFFSHDSSDGTPFNLRVRRFAFALGVGEALAALAQDGAAAIVGTWIDSPPHRAILLGGQYRRIGIGRRWGSLGAGPMALVTADFATAH
jgi:uncharacterized protein YkwD